MANPRFDFNIDQYLNPYIPRPRLHLLPKPLSWILGYRDTPRQHLIGNLLIAFWSFVGAVAGICVIEAVFHTHPIQSQGTPIIIASFGAAAILEFNTITSPLAQPRNAFMGQLCASLIGVGLTKLFALSIHFESLRWIAGALAVGLTSALMTLTNTIYPPAGATALVAATNPVVADLGWFLVPVMVLGNVLMLSCACVVNNVQRRWPLYWWTGDDLTGGRESDLEDVEKHEGRGEIVVTAERVDIPAWMVVSEEENRMLDALRLRLQHKLGVSRTMDSDLTQVVSPT
ncbi:hypothetical protein BP6252_05188 [Coleophoma cylindrospora]|uniref:HPP transmembrane region domain-containing protein n=1 Tax=Coleophoma cylindrospora TaxID=1849047 RepID=A0A3D8RT11_9HELO|nr:hypothetical protein BP6252_05188 [Coleophoma cylindrospora]